MNELHVKLDTDERSERPVEKTHTLYRRPEMFKVARAVELIRGAFWKGPRDNPNSWPIWNLTF
jgi:hypothetical protein